MLPVSVSSETGRLTRALVHRPGCELAYVSPYNFKDFFFNDILYPPRARQEHNEFVSLLRDVLGVEILYFDDLLAKALSARSEEQRLHLLQDVASVEDLSVPDAQRLLDAALTLDHDSLAEHLIAGEPASTEESVSEFLERSLYHLPPLPNLMLARDLSVVIGDRFFLGWNAAATRRRENLLWRFILQEDSSDSRDSTQQARRSQKPLVSGGCEDWMDGVAPDPDSAVFLEGGNVLPVSERVLLVGQGRRTPAVAVERLLDWLAERVDAELQVLVVSLPSSIDHLDTVFTMLSESECLVFPPAILRSGPDAVDVLHLSITNGDQIVRQAHCDLIPALSDALGGPVTAIMSGGESLLHQRRERWWGGASALAVEPGRVLLFQSNERTIHELQESGYAVLESAQVLEGGQNPYEYEKCVVAVRGTELTRARSGPHSLVLPLERKGY